MSIAEQAKITKESTLQVCTDLTKLLQRYEEQMNLISEKEKEFANKEKKLKEMEKVISDKEKNMMNEFEKHKEEMMKNLQEREENIEKLERKITNSTSIATKFGASKRVKLDVGGKIFSITLETLLSERNTFFVGYFNEQFNPTPEEHDQAFFIDRPPEHFHLILNHLRKIDISERLNEMKQVELKEFIEEMMFYQIESIRSILPPMGRKILKEKYNIIENELLIARCEEKDIEGNWRYNGTNIDALDFKISTACSLGGVGVLAAKNNPYSITLKIMKGDVVMVENKYSIVGKEEKYVLLEFLPTKLEANVWYYCSAQIKGPNSLQVQNGKSVVQIDKLSVEFRKSNTDTNGTDGQRGQFYALQFIL